MNIISIVSDVLTPAVVAKLAVAHGIAPARAQSAIKAAIPALLMGIAKKSAQPTSLAVLAGLLGRQEINLHDLSGDLIGSTRFAALVNSGCAALETLFGVKTSHATSTSLGAFVDVPTVVASDILALVAQIALSAIAEEQRAMAVESSGVADLLASQKDNIAAAMPLGFEAALHAGERSDDLTSSASSVVARGHVAVAPKLPVAAAGPHAMSRWLPALIGIVVAIAAWQLFVPRPSAESASAAIIVNNVDVGKRTAVLYEGIKASISGIRDGASASASLPKLREHAAALLDIRDLVEKLPPSGRTAFASFLKPLLPGLDALTIGALKAPDAEAIVKPVLDQIAERLKMLAKG